LIVVKIKLMIAIFFRPLISRRAVWFSPVRSSPDWRISTPGMARLTWRYTVKKKVHEFPLSNRDVTNKTPPGQE
jgi:hypothetical protein